MKKWKIGTSFQNFFMICGNEVCRNYKQKAFEVHATQHQSAVGDVAAPFWMDFFSGDNT